MFAQPLELAHGRAAVPGVERALHECAVGLLVGRSMSSTDSHRRAVSITAEDRRLAAFVEPDAETADLRIAPVGTPIDPT